ncbi:MAG TPA: YaiO family outer membrane beta-barrel protein [Candidatus Angelobacter sp.]
MKLIPIAIILLVCGWATAQNHQPIPQGSSLPGMSSMPMGMNGPGFLELGGSYFNVTGSSPRWDDAYANALISGGRNAVSGQLSRQNRYGDTGWYYGFGWTRVWSENWYSELDFGTSTVQGFFLPKVRTDALINRKLLPRKQLVLQLGAGYDLSKRVNGTPVANSDYRGQVGAIYYFERPWIVQGGAIFTHASPGNILAPAGYVAVTRGHVKEHYLTARANFGREGYEIFSAGQTIFNFPFQDYSVNWRQWMAPNWGFSATAEYESKPIYHRLGGTIGLFLDF